MAVKIYKNQTNVYIIWTPKCDAFGNNFFPLLSIIECYKQTCTDFMYWFIPDLLLSLTMCSSVLCPPSFVSTSEHFGFRWSVKGSHKNIVFWILSLPIRLSTIQYSAIVGKLLISITKFFQEMLSVLPW